MKLFRDNLIELISKIAGTKNFYELIDEFVRSGIQTTAMLGEEIVSVGEIPSVFGIGSSEEKLWAKAADIMVGLCIDVFGGNSTILKKRANSADICTTFTNFSLVTDAKCFRKTRTAINPKDFKVAAVNDWRLYASATYALIVAPHDRYPSVRSQLYSQAVSHNVVLLSYTHLRLLLPYKIENFERLFTGQFDATNSASTYWQIIDAACADIIGQPVVLEKRKVQEKIEESCPPFQRSEANLDYIFE